MSFHLLKSLKFFYFKKHLHVERFFEPKKCNLHFFRTPVCISLFQSGLRNGFGISARLGHLSWRLLAFASAQAVARSLPLALVGVRWEGREGLSPPLTPTLQ